jgi:insecticidal toxin complex protein TccC
MDSIKRAPYYKATPQVQVFDNRGAVVREVQYNRCQSGERELLITAHHYNTLGQLIQSTDPRLFETQAGQATLEQITSLSGRILYSRHIDSGRKLQLYHAQELLLWSLDNAGTEQTWQHDVLGRVTAVWERADAATSAECRERLVYGDSLNDTKAAKNANLRQQVYYHQDTAGQRCYSAYDINQHALCITQQFLKDSENAVNWPLCQREALALLEEEDYTSHWQYNALGEIHTQIDAKGNQQIFHTNLLGQLKQSFFCLSEDKTLQPLLLEADYNAHGQPLCEKLANGTEIQRHYEMDTLRLIQLKTLRKKTGCYLRNLCYHYDPVGNIIKIEDKSHASEFRNNQKIVAENQYEYDALYQLIQTKGRENSTNQTENHALPELNLLNNPDKQQLSPYTRFYIYDKAGNIQKIQHSGKKNYSLTLQINTTSNHSVQQKNSLADFKQSFDANGNLLYLRSEQSNPFSWNKRNQLQTRLTRNK